MMHYKISQLDTRLSDIENGATPRLTLRQWIQEMEDGLGIPRIDLSQMNDEQLTDHIAYIDYLWEK